MIGRHKECQIRPKSRSVSRRHCLLHRVDDHVRAIDLDSTSGTRLNDERVEPRKWFTLSDGDKLRCGKILFRVAIETAAETESGQADDAGEAGSMLAGEAWQEFDIAEYLQEADDADREERYESIRSQQQPDEPPEHESVSDELDIFEDHDGEDDDDSLPLVDDEETSKPRLPDRKKRRVIRNKGPSLLKQPEKLKMYGAVLLMVLMAAGLTYSLFRFVSGPETRVIIDLDE